MREKILQLRKEGKTFREIQKLVPCSASTVWYHCGKGAKEKHRRQKRKNYARIQIEIKSHFEGKCKICGYNKCLSALEFHHLDSSKKEKTVSRFIQAGSKSKAYKEAEKCILICANCHRELHENEKLIRHPTMTDH